MAITNITKLAIAIAVVWGRDCDELERGVAFLVVGLDIEGDGAHGLQCHGGRLPERHIEHLSETACVMELSSRAVAKPAEPCRATSASCTDG